MTKRKYVMQRMDLCGWVTVTNLSFKKDLVKRLKNVTNNTFVSYRIIKE